MNVWRVCNSSRVCVCVLLQIKTAFIIIWHNDSATRMDWRNLKYSLNESPAKNGPQSTIDTESQAKQRYIYIFHCCQFSRVQKYFRHFCIRDPMHYILASYKWVYLDINLTLFMFSFLARYALRSNADYKEHAIRTLLTTSIFVNPFSI